MPFYRCNLSGGGGGVADCLANLNERIETLGQNEFLFFSNSNPTPNSGEKKTISETYTPMTLNADAGGLLIIDCSKLTYSHLQVNSSTDIYAVAERGGDWEGKMYVTGVTSGTILNFATYDTKYIFIVLAPRSYSWQFQIRAYN